MLPDLSACVRTALWHSSMRDDAILNFAFPLAHAVLASIPRP